MDFELNELACQYRRDFNVNDSDPIDIFRFAIDKIRNLTIVFLDMGKSVSGACRKSEAQQVIFINSKHSKGRQSFTLAHELYHLEFDDFGINFCGLDSDDDIEKRANAFASYLLMPSGALMKYKKEHSIDEWSLDSIIACEQYFQMSHDALLFRLKELGDIDGNDFKMYKRDIRYNAMIRGYDVNLYDPYIDKDNFTIGNYINLAEKAFSKDLISRGLKEEFLLEAYREDIVFNL